METHEVIAQFWCVSMRPKINSFGMLNNGKVKNESACAQQKCWFAEKPISL